MEDELKAGHEGCSCFKTSFDTECEHASETVLEVLAAEFVVLVALQARVVHAFHCRVALEEFRYGEGVVAAALRSERQGLEPLKHEEGIEWGCCRAYVAQSVHAYASCKSSITEDFLVDKAVVAF